MTGTFSVPSVCPPECIHKYTFYMFSGGQTPPLRWMRTTMIDSKPFEQELYHILACLDNGYFHCLVERDKAGNDGRHQRSDKHIAYDCLQT